MGCIFMAGEKGPLGERGTRCLRLFRTLGEIRNEDVFPGMA
jgi:hypothetical protein